MKKRHLEILGYQVVQVYYIHTIFLYQYYTELFEETVFII